MHHFQFDFADGYLGWAPGFSDFHTGSLESYQLEHDWRERPRSAGRGRALFISGMNRSDDLFMYHVRRFDGLQPFQAGEAHFKVTFASKYVSGSGIGGDPARSVYVKACMADVEPRLHVIDDTYRLNIDIGRQANPGANSIVLGDIEKPSIGNDDYALIERSSKTALKWNANDSGSVWILFGTDSGYEGETSLYYTSLELSLA
jgi:hypothetical protein